MLVDITPIIDTEFFIFLSTLINLFHIPIFWLVLSLFMQTYDWYAQLIKPSWSPPSFLFGPVWTVLYILIAISFGNVFALLFSKKIDLGVAMPFILNLFFNAIFTTLQFGLKNNYLAAIDILLVLGTLIWAMIAIYPHSKWIAYMQIPYLLWVMFASLLQLSVTYLNR